MRPFSIVEDRGFHALMKTGRPEYYLPSRSTVSRDVKEVYKKVRKRIGKMLQVNSIVVFKKKLKKDTQLQLFRNTMAC
jgi:hypothetical protein